jgi:tetratricopeptide (TPR) repeat protein
MLIGSEWAFHSFRAEHRLALSRAEHIEKLGKTSGVGVQLLGRRLHGLTCFYLGEFMASRTLLERSLGLSDPAHRLGPALSEDPYAVVLAHLAVTLAHLGYIDQARSRLNEAELEARRLKHANTLAIVLVWANWIDWLTHSPALQRHTEELLTLSTEHGYPLFLAYGIAFRGRMLSALGQAQEGLTLLARGLGSIRATGTVVGTPNLLRSIAETHAKLGNPIEGLKHLVEATAIMKTTEEWVSKAELHRVQGDLLNATGDRAGADQHYRQAIAVADRQSAKLPQLRASVSLARLWCDQGKRVEARDLLGPICNWFTEGCDAPDLKNARVLLDELG